MKSKEEKIKEQIEFYEKIKGKELSEEEKAHIRSQIENPVPKDIELRDGEVDIRELSDKDFRQLYFRELRDINMRLKFIQEITNEVVMALYAQIKISGKNPFKEIEDVSIEAMEKMNEE